VTRSFTAPTGLLLACALTGMLRGAADRARQPAVQEQYDIVSFPAEVAGPLSFGFRSLVADAAFLEAIQVFGANRLPTTAAKGQRSDRLLAQLLTFATDLDPKFRGAYRFAANALPRPTSDGKVAGVRAAVRLLDKGRVERPELWVLPFQAGFLYSYYLGDAVKAAEAMAQAAKLPGSPAYLGLLATRLASQAGDLDVAAQLANEMREQASDDETRKTWEDRALDIETERRARRLEAAAASFRARVGRSPSSLDELARNPELPQGLPAEPRGGRFLLGPDGTVRSDQTERLRLREGRGNLAGMEVL
jgi:hypothetical protein